MKNKQKKGRKNVQTKTRIKELRKKNNLTQKEVGAILNKSQQGYAHLENGEADLCIDDLVKLSLLYKVSTDYILYLTNKR